MKVLMLKNAFRPDGSLAPTILKKAELVDLPDDQAEVLIDRGVAVEPKIEKPKKSETPDDTWTVPELKVYAEENLIDLGGAKIKPELLAVIKAVTPTA